MPAPKELDPEASLWHLLGAYLRYFRIKANVTQQQLGGRLHSTGSFVGQIETAERRPSVDFVAELDRALDASGLLTATAFHAYRMAEEQPGWFETFAAAERRAARIRTFQPQAIPGLLQCEEYSRSLFEAARLSAATAHAFLEKRLARSRLLTGEEAPYYWAAIDEAALIRMSHVPHIAKPQLEHLLELMDLSNVVLEVVPMDCGLHPCMDGSFVLLTIPGRGECAYADDMFKGKFVTESHTVAEVQRRYDLLRAEALSPSRSQQLLWALLKENS